MNDCPNGDIRDALPDYVHDRLDTSARALVGEHVRTCIDCQAEVALLQSLRSALSYAPTFDLAAVTAAIPPHRRATRRSWVGWRAAAAITVMVGAGTSILVTRDPVPLRPDPAAVSRAISTPRAAAIPASAPGTTAQVTPAPQGTSASQQSRIEVGSTSREPTAPQGVAKPQARELALGGGALTDLSDRELASLLQDIESLDAVPTIEVETVALAPIAPVPTNRGAP